MTPLSSSSSLMIWFATLSEEELPSSLKPYEKKSATNGRLSPSAIGPSTPVITNWSPMLLESPISKMLEMTLSEPACVSRILPCPLSTSPSSTLVKPLRRTLSFRTPLVFATCNRFTVTLSGPKLDASRLK